MEYLKEHATFTVVGPHQNVVVSRESVSATASPYFKRKKFFGSKGLLEVTFTTFETEEEDAIDLGTQNRFFSPTPKCHL